MMKQEGKPHAPIEAEAFVSLKTLFEKTKKVPLSGDQEEKLRQEVSLTQDAKTGFLLKPESLSAMEESLGIEDQSTAEITGEERIGRVIEAILKHEETSESANSFLCGLEEALEIDPKKNTTANVAATNHKARMKAVEKSASSIVDQNSQLTNQVKEHEKKIASNGEPHEIVRAVLEGLLNVGFSELSTQQKMDIVFKLKDYGVKINTNLV